MIATIKERPLSANPYGRGNPQWGVCHGDGRIVIDPRLKPLHFLDTLIHELLHREFPDLSEDCVTARATVMADEIWKMNFRRVLQ